MKYQLFLSTIIAHVIVLILPLRAQTPFVIDTQASNWDLSAEVYIYADSSASLGVEEIHQLSQQVFVPINTIDKPQNITQDYIWLKIVLDNQNQKEDFVLTLDNWLEITIYSEGEKGVWEEHSVGFTYTLAERELNYGRFLHLPLEIPSGDTRVFYVRCSQSAEAIKALNQTYNFYKRINLSTRAQADLSYLERCLFYAFYAGILFIMFIYKIVLFIYIRDKAYLFFVFYLLSLGCLAFVESGLVDYLFFYDTTGGSVNYYMPCLTTGYIFLLLFTRSYLRLPSLFKGLNKFILCLLGFEILIFLDNFLGILGNLFFYNLYIISFSMIFVSLRCIWLGFRPAVYFFIADSMFLASLILWTFTSTGIIQYILPIEPINFGNLLQVTFLSLGLAYRFRVMQGEINQHQAEMQALIESQKEELEVEVERQTHQIQMQNEEIQVQNEELLQQQEEIITQRDYVESKNTELERINEELMDKEQALRNSFKELEETQEKISLKNKELEIKDRRIGSSIKAALSIQTATLPHTPQLQEMLGNHFVIYKPRDVVSGDFYWLQQIDKYRILVTADCTGHGVSGALMSMIGNTVLDKVICTQKHTDPAKILERIHEEVRTALRQEETQNNLGMDMTVLVMEDYNQWLTLVKFAGAKNSIFIRYPSDERVSEIKGSRRAIGGIQNLETPFQNHHFLLEPNTMIYTGSDGYIDQNNAQRKRFGNKAFLKLLIDIGDQPLDRQKEILEQKLATHMQDTAQRDDILLIGFKI